MTIKPTDTSSESPAGTESADETERRQRAEFQVGGQDRTLSPEEQLDQIGSYLDAHYPLPDFTPPWAGGSGDPSEADSYIARLPDRTTHAAMLMLGSALDHSMPGVAYPGDVSVSDVDELNAQVFTPTNPIPGAWAVSFHSGGWWRGSGDALEYSWRPEVAAAAELSGTTIIDLDHPLAPQHSVDDMLAAAHRALDYARGHGATHISAWGYSSGGALAALLAPSVHSLVLTFPDLSSLERLPEKVRAGNALPAPETWPESLVQVATADEIAARPEGLAGNAQITVRDYVARHRISTPEVARDKIRDVAEFLRSVATHR